MYMKKIMHKEKMNYDRRKNDSLIHTLLDDMKKMNDVITRLQQEITQPIRIRNHTDRERWVNSKNRKNC